MVFHRNSQGRPLRTQGVPPPRGDAQTQVVRQRNSLYHAPHEASVHVLLPRPLDAYREMHPEPAGQYWTFPHRLEQSGQQFFDGSRTEASVREAESSLMIQMDGKLPIMTPLRKLSMRIPKGKEQGLWHMPAFCGEGGIRTLGTRLGYTRFPGEPVRPLRHLS